MGVRVLLQISDNLDNPGDPESTLIETREWDGNGNLIRSTDALGRISTHDYDAANQRILSELPGNRTLHWTWTVHGDLESETAANGAVTVHHYDALGRRLSTVLPGEDADTRLYDWDDAGNLIAETDARGHSTHYDYDGLNRRILQREPLLDGDDERLEQHWKYDTAGNVIEHIDRVGVVTTHGYDGENRLTETTIADVRMLQQSYDGDGNRITDTDALGRSTLYDYDLAGRLIRETRPLGAIRSYDYDPIGNLLRDTDADGYTRHYEYDLRQRRIAHSEALRGELSPEDYQTLTEYDGLDRPERVRSARGYVTHYDYNAAGWLERITDPLNHITRYTYDANGNRVTQTDARDHTTEFEYDLRDRLTLRRYPDLSEDRYEYDAENNRILHQDAGNQARRYTYDALNRQTRAEYPEAQTQGGQAYQIDITYDGEGRRTQVTETAIDLAARSSHYVYDAFGRLTRETDVHGQVMEHHYDLVGNRIRRIDASGTSQYGIDALNRLITLQAPGREMVVYQYSPAGRVEQIDHPGGTRSEQHFNDRARIARIDHYQSGQRSAHYAYDYDANGNRITQIEDLGLGEVETVYTYDPADRLTETTRAGQRTVYTLDPVANRIEEQRFNNGVLSEHRLLSYDDRDQLTQISDGAQQLITEHHYDPRGNRIATIAGGTHTVFRFGARDRLLGIHLQGAPPESGPRYRYDDAGFRIEELRPDQGLRYRYDGSTLAFETNVVGNLQARYDHGPDRLLAETRNSQTLTWLTDTLKTPVKRLTEQGDTYSTTRYDEYGQVDDETSPDTPRFGFTGYQRSAGTDLYYAEQRWYDPDTGRFISEDPLWGDAQTPLSLHRYLYAYANPTVWVDPTGMYNEAGHYYTTLYVASLLGYSQEDAATLALYSQLPDEVGHYDAVYRSTGFARRTASRLGSAMVSPGYIAPSIAGVALERNRLNELHGTIHALTGSSSSAVTQRTVELVSEASLSLEATGVAIHRLGDSFSHRVMGQEQDTYEPGLGHARHGTRPDEIHMRPELFGEFVATLTIALAYKKGVELTPELLEEIVDPMLHMAVSLKNEVRSGQRELSERVLQGERVRGFDYYKLHSDAARSAIEDTRLLAERAHGSSAPVRPEQVSPPLRGRDSDYYQGQIRSLLRTGASEYVGDTEARRLLWGLGDAYGELKSRDLQ